MADAPEKKREEQVRITRLGGKWSGWMEIAAPNIPVGGSSRKKIGQKDKSVLEDIPWNCGVYELKVDNGDESYVVYIGSTCRKSDNRKKCSCKGDKYRCHKGESCSLQLRITEYARNGSHKAELIDQAIEEGFSLYVRYCTSRNPRILENKYLALYDYAWNERNNGQIRNVFQAG